jgi:hypothetical protein
MNIPEKLDRPWKGLAMEENLACCQDVSNVPRYSVRAISKKEAHEFKWVRSEEAGRDLGEAALRAWIREHWWGFLRARWVEHLQGTRFWIELDNGDFGLLVREFHDQRPLLDNIVHHLIAGKENLDIINWAESTEVPIEPVHNILLRLDINGHRLFPDLVDASSDPD